MTETQPNLDGWDDFLGNFFKAEMVKTWPALTIVTYVVGKFDEEDKAHIIYDLTYNNRKYKWEPNKSNIEIMRKLGVVSPRGLVGRKVYFKQVMNFNPTIKKKVPSVEIEKIE